MSINLNIDNNGNCNNIKRQLGNNVTIVDTGSFYDIEDTNIINDVCDKIYDSAISNNKHIICFDLSSEGLLYNTLNFIDKLVKLMSGKEYGHVLTFYVLSGALPDYSNVIYYKQACKQFGWNELNIILTNQWENLQKNKTIEHLDFYNSFNIEKKSKSKKFNFYNRSIKPHRLMLCSELLKRNLIDLGYVSFNITPDEINSLQHNNGNIIHKLMPNIANSIINTLVSYKELFPISLGLSEDNLGIERSHRITESDKEHWENSYFSVVAESSFFHDLYDEKDCLRSDLSLNCVLLSEKTYKCIQGKMPFIIAGFTGSLEILKRFGYKTFHPFIDETYDSIKNDEDRLISIANEIQRLCSLSEYELNKWQENIYPIADHNYKTLLNSKNVYLKNSN